MCHRLTDVLFSIDALLVTGSKAPHVQTVYNTHKNMNKKKTTLLVVDNVSDVMAEAVSAIRQRGH